MAAILVGLLVGGCGGTPATAPDPGDTLERLWVGLDQRRPDLDLLRRSVGDVDPVVRWLVARAFVALPHPSYVELLAPLLLDADARVREAAFFAIGRCGGPKAIEVLGFQAGSPVPRIRELAVQALGHSADQDALRVVLPRLRDDHPAVRGDAALAAVRLAGDRLRDPASHLVPEAQRIECVLLVLGALGREKDDEAHWRLTYALAHLVPPQAEGMLCTLARAPQRLSRLFALRGLGGLAPSPAVRDALLAGLADPDPAIVLEAVQSLGSPARQLDPERRGASGPNHDDAEVARRLAALAVQHESVHVRTACLVLLGRYAAHAGIVTPALVAGARHADANVRSAAVQGLARLQGDAALPYLREAARDQDPRARAGAALGCGFAGAEPAQALLAGLARDAESRVVMAALTAVARHAGAPWAEAILVDALRRRDLGIREAAAEAALAFRGASLLNSVRSAMADSSGYEYAEARRLLLQAALRMARDDAERLVLLREALRDPALVVRRLACAELSARGEAVPRGQPGHQDGLVTPRIRTEIPLALLTERPRVRIVTERGTIEIELDPERAPIHCANLLRLAERGAYRGRILHRVVPNFVIQGGDRRGDGSGAESAWGGLLRDELSLAPFVAGTLGMPKTADPDTGGDQFFITLVPAPHLDGRYTAFGRVVSGLAVAERSEIGDRILSVTRVR